MFKVGDRVRALRSGRRGGRDVCIVAPREQYEGHEGVIHDIHNLNPAEEGYYGVQFENGYDAISGVHLELAEPATPATPATSPQAAPTLRDQFAMAALTGLLASEDMIDEDKAATLAYDCADAMLAARDGKAGAA